MIFWHLHHYYHKNNGQVEACLKYLKCTIEKCNDTNQDINVALLQTWSTLVGVGLASLAAVLLNRPIEALLPKMNRAPINRDNDDVQYEALEDCQSKYNKDNDIQKFLALPQGLQ